MNKELEIKLVDKVLKHLEKYPIENWKYRIICDRYGFLSPSERLGLVFYYEGIKVFLIEKLYEEDYKSFRVNSSILTKIVTDEQLRRSDLFLLESQKREKELLKSQKREKELLEKFFDEDF